ncbi:MAG: bacterio-opsin activator domain-containing protein, partial [Halobacteriales archaeon]
MTGSRGSDRYGTVLETLRSVNAAVVNGNGRDDVERMACERLTEGTYDGAWLLTPPVDEEVTVRASVGGEVPGSVREAATSPGSRGTVLDRSDGVYAAVPCSHDGSTEAVLVVRTDTFDDAERDLLIEVGDTIAHGLAAIRRKTALMNETAVELELRIADATEPIFDDPLPDASFEFVRTIPITDDAVLQYVAVEGMAPEAFEREMDTFDGVDSVRRVGSDGERTIFETRYRGPSIVGTVAAVGGRVVRSTIEDDDHYLVARVPDEGAVDRLLAAVTERFPGAQVRARRSLIEGRGSNKLETATFDRLTDRQRVVLETAHAAGYFHRPRRS